MPCYQLLCFAKPGMTPERLSELFRAVARVVYREGGGFRRVENLGVRPVAYPLRKGGARYDEVRWVSATLDVAPSALPAVYAAVKEERDTLQHHTLVSKEPLAAFSNKRPEKLKRFPAAMRWSSVAFDADTLSLRVREPPGGGGAGAGAPAQLR